MIASNVKLRKADSPYRKVVMKSAEEFSGAVLGS